MNDALSIVSIRKMCLSRALGCSTSVLLVSRAAASPLGVAAQLEDVLALPVVLRHQQPGA